MKPINQRKLTPYQKFEQESRQITDAPKVKKTPTVRDEGKFVPSETRRLRDAQPASEPTDDDLAPETLIHEDGALSPHEVGGDIPADETYRIVGEEEIGAGYGLDEAELGRTHPLDGKSGQPAHHQDNRKSSSSIQKRSK
jgi:hypothetical protein